MGLEAAGLLRRSCPRIEPTCSGSLIYHNLLLNYYPVSNYVQTKHYKADRIRLSHRHLAALITGG